MKHFKLVGPVTTREFDIEDDQMLDFQAVSMKEFESKSHLGNYALDVFGLQNEKIYSTEEK